MFENIENLTKETLKEAFEELKKEKEYGELPNGIVWNLYEEINKKNKSITIIDVKEELLFEIAKRKFE